MIVRPKVYLRETSGIVVFVKQATNSLNGVLIINYNFGHVGTIDTHTKGKTFHSHKKDMRTPT